jgi:hypothetical protein
MGSVIGTKGSTQFNRRFPRSRPGRAIARAVASIARLDPASPKERAILISAYQTGNGISLYAMRLRANDAEFAS